jgi:hypothetical protein
MQGSAFEFLRNSRAHLAFLNGEKEPSMHNCAFCRNPLKPWYQWKGSDGRLYCNEFCADASETTGELVPHRSEFRPRSVQSA